MTQQAVPQDQAAIYKRLLASSLSTSERVRVARTLTRLEAAHRQELHNARRASNEAVSQMHRCSSEAALSQSTAAAGEAKLLCMHEEMRGRLTRLELQLTDSAAQLEQASERALTAEQQCTTTEQVLTRELRMLETSLHQKSAVLAQERKTGVANSGKLGELQAQLSRGGALLSEQQQHISDLRKRLGQQQRRALKLQAASTTAEAAQTCWTHERSQLQANLAEANAARQHAEQHAELLVAREAAMAKEAKQEREMAAEVLQRTREVHAREVASLENRMYHLAELVTRLEGDNSVVSLRNGGGSTVAEYIRSLSMRIQRRSKSISVGATCRQSEDRL
mmetsp:Transcript_14140/g.23525  ORF Transcript_14140/g.23525 Transcript_14140/m.23525 type:complete len:337 (-) Transcript_14140:585-1595(-)|eukprot:CAMPEP_0119336274 /NCGR_PEP_ID=MMETSP1333-20130426/91461_1 /TAXON_ID=418940 /ORGANISM="Scyphosphaera apsteinii, Strain RCC1455" /LENGTH=336 /DNA_ID=CAMNT_0007347037 /DNA_START=77 /DNA_END=1087 /DNA_ORIENTATION=+